MALHWDGTAWSTIRTPNIGGESNILQAVDAVAPNSVWAVGNYQDENHIPRTLAQHWDGTAWTVIPTPNQNASSNVLTALVARTATDVWAVGASMPAAPAPAYKRWCCTGMACNGRSSAAPTGGP